MFPNAKTCMLVARSAGSGLGNSLYISMAIRLMDAPVSTSAGTEEPCTLTSHVLGPAPGGVQGLGMHAAVCACARQILSMTGFLSHFRCWLLGCDGSRAAAGCLCLAAHAPLSLCGAALLVRRRCWKSAPAERRGSPGSAEVLAGSAGGW
ncbi:hypothetical protein NDU88_005744 [Pleurodeles waltl]|uniref:Uncharacterized protein n=1 Tax=Pleurodeles waltl TaxID=8319 RepID=A0AAV7SMJ9_PLEWA|nr:hypothetical protein NDU88_005744 [Pleurodeles waltl]